ncbi:hypothetical protein JXQ70_03545 [bacterium]|nr:hypothetical protein [bacterium]
MMKTQGLELAYRYLNLRFNPFGEADLNQRRAMVICDDFISEHSMRTPNQVVQIIGKPGCGKTSCLLGLQAQFPEMEYMRCGEKRCPILNTSRQLLLDEFDLLTKRQRLWMLKTYQVKAVSTHTDFSHEYRRSGYVSISYYPEENITVELVQRLIEHRLEWARRGPGPLPVISRAHIEQSLRCHGNNLRSIENDLYEYIQRQETVG